MKTIATVLFMFTVFLFSSCPAARKSPETALPPPSRSTESVKRCKEELSSTKEKLTIAQYQLATLRGKKKSPVSKKTFICGFVVQEEGEGPIPVKLDFTEAKSITFNGRTTITFVGCSEDTKLEDISPSMLGESSLQKKVIATDPPMENN
jgi:hypothetical protein